MFGKESIEHISHEQIQALLADPANAVPQFSRRMCGRINSTGRAGWPNRLKLRDRASQGCSLLMHPSTGRLIAPTCSCDRQGEGGRSHSGGRQNFVRLIFFPKVFWIKIFFEFYIFPCPPPPSFLRNVL